MEHVDEDLRDPEDQVRFHPLHEGLDILETGIEETFHAYPDFVPEQ